MKVWVQKLTAFLKTHFMRSNYETKTDFDVWGRWLSLNWIYSIRIPTSVQINCTFSGLSTVRLGGGCFLPPRPRGSAHVRTQRTALHVARIQVRLRYLVLQWTSTIVRFRVLLPDVVGWGFQLGRPPLCRSDAIRILYSAALAQRVFIILQDAPFLQHLGAPTLPTFGTDTITRTHDVQAGRSH